MSRPDATLGADNRLTCEPVGTGERQPAEPDVRKLAAEALYDQCGPIGHRYRWEVISEETREQYRRMADAVLAAVTPVIRRQVAEEIAWHIEHPIGPQEVRWAPIARRWMTESAAIARSHSTQPTEERS